MINFLIDNINIYETYGILVADGGLAGLVSLPPMDLNAIPQNDWFEYNGVEVPEIITPTFGVKQFQMPVVATDISKINDFIKFLMSKTYHVINSDMFVAEYGGFSKIRYVSCTAITSVKNLGRFTLNFSDDSRYFFGNPNMGFNLQAPKTNYYFRNENWGDLGVGVLSGTDAEVLKAASPKENDIDELTGNYNRGAMLFKTKTVTLKLNMCSSKTYETTKQHRIQAFWDTFYHFAYLLIYRAFTTRQIKAIINGKTYGLNYYYNSCNVSKFYVLQNYAFWIDFNINITIINPILP